MAPLPHAAQPQLDRAECQPSRKIWDTQADIEAGHCIVLRRRFRPGPACIVVLRGPERGRTYSLRGYETSIGRSSTSDICIPQRSVSRTHATIIVGDTGLRIRDNDSTNGTYVNGHAIDDVSLEDGDVIHMGESAFKVLIGDAIKRSSTRRPTGSPPSMGSRRSSTSGRSPTH